MVFVIHADSAAVAVHVLVLDRNKLASGSSDYQVNITCSPNASGHNVVKSIFWAPTNSDE